MTTSSHAVRIMVTGARQTGERWASAFRAVDGVEVALSEAGTSQELSDVLSHEACCAVALTSPSDLPAMIRTAVLAGCDVFIATPAALTAAQFGALAELARRRERIIRFLDDIDDDERVRFVRRMTHGAQALWRAYYLRSLRTGEDASLDALVIGELQLALDLLGRRAERVFAVAPSAGDESGALDAVTVTLSFEGGAVATIQVSAVEPERRREAVLACDGRTILLDAYNARAPLQIQASARHGGPRPGAAWSEVISEFPVAQLADPVLAASRGFARAVRARDLVVSNAGAFAEAAQVWEAARRSITTGMPEELRERHAIVSRPALRLIAGGGHGGGAAAAPRLTVVHSEPHRLEPAKPVA